MVTRLVSAESEISSEKLRSGNLRADEIQQIHSKIVGLAEAPLFIDDTAGLSIFELRAKARRLKSQHDIKLLIIDYLQLMSGGGDNKNGNREQEISMISRSLKSIAKELNIPVLALSQLSRAVETRGGDKRPQLSDLRESGSIEQDADMVQFIHRAEYYGLTEDEDGNSTTGMATIIIAKHRNGSVGDVKLKFVNHLAKFQDFEQGNNDFGDFDNASMPIGEDFDSPNTIPSKMNDTNDDNFDYGMNNEDDDTPF